MKARIHQLSQLSFQEIVLLCLSVILLPSVALLLRMIGFDKTRLFLTRMVDVFPVRRSAEEDPTQTMESVERMVSIAARHGFYRANCLKKALVTWWLLARRGIEVELVIGVRKTDHHFQAHAWTQFEGLALGEAGDVQQRHTVFSFR